MIETCQSSQVAGYCLGIHPFNAFMALSLFAAAALMLNEWWMEVAGDE